MSYRAPVPEMLFTLRHVAGLDGVDPDDAEARLRRALEDRGPAGDA